MSINKYSTGPVENAVGNVGAPGESRTFFVKALNNGHKAARVKILLYRLNGSKVLVETRTFTLPAQSSNFRALNVANLLQFEVQIKTDSPRVLVSGWGKNAKGRLVAAHRFVQEELIKIKKKRRHHLGA
ncbi:hypothetical protein ACE3NQ_07895 [Paenibacillus terreus]|uniref:Uncharacterized protein n=1 Tax=Paenibacillus terreus TaxID=1387834 RepID=A0ABV5B561_9BACL